MPRGQPDFGMYAATTVVVGLSDMAELAVRLGSISIFDRRGKVIDLDDFEGQLLKWERIAIGIANATFSSDSCKSGTQSVYMRVTDNTNRRIYMERSLSLLPSKRLGLEIAYSLPASTAFLLMRLYRAISTGYSYAQVKLEFTDKKIYYYDSAGNPQEFADLPTASDSEFCYYPVKMVADFDTGKYVRFISEGIEYDLSSYDLYSVITPSTPIVSSRFTWERNSGEESTIYLDDYILTMDEP